MEYFSLTIFGILKASFLGELIIYKSRVPDLTNFASNLQAFPRPQSWLLLNLDCWSLTEFSAWWPRYSKTSVPWRPRLRPQLCFASFSVRLLKSTKRFDQVRTIYFGRLKSSLISKSARNNFERFEAWRCKEVRVDIIIRSNFLISDLIFLFSIGACELWALFVSV